MLQTAVPFQRIEPANLCFVSGNNNACEWFVSIEWVMTVATDETTTVVDLLIILNCGKIIILYFI